MELKKDQITHKDKTINCHWNSQKQHKTRPKLGSIFKKLQERNVNLVNAQLSYPLSIEDIEK